MQHERPPLGGQRREDDMERKHQNLKVLAQRDPEAAHIWVAQTLQGNLVGQGSTLKEALDELRYVVLSMLAVALESGAGDDAFAGSAPLEDQALFDAVLNSGRPVAEGLTDDFFSKADRDVCVLATWLRVGYPAQQRVSSSDEAEIVSSGFVRAEAA
jgi:hypothetical protein